MLRSVLLAAMGFCLTVSARVSEANESLVVVVEQSEWLPEAKKMAGRETQFRVWSSGYPRWFSEFSKRETRVIVLCGALRQDREQGMWRERLSAQGCKLVILKHDRSTELVTASEIHERMHAALVEAFPEEESTWTDNFRKAMRASPAFKAVQTLSWFAAFDSR